MASAKVKGFETAERSAPCPGGCGRTVTWEAIRLDDGVGQPRFMDGPTPLCPECEAEEERRKKEERRRREKQEREERRKRMAEILHELGVNVRDHGHCTLEEWDDSESGPEPLEAARDFVRNTREAGSWEPVRGLYLWGPTGNGKSQLAVAIVRELLSDPGWSPRRVVYDRADALITEVQDTYGSDRRTGSVIDRRLEAEVWVLDDLGTEKVSDDVTQVLTQIISRRACWPNVITSNLNPEEYEARHDGLARVGSRLGPRYFRTVKVTGRDRRFD